MRPMHAPARRLPDDPGYAERCHASFGRQAAMLMMLPGMADTQE
jgi:hypothetical protein